MGIYKWVARYVRREGRERKGEREGGKEEEREGGRERERESFVSEWVLS